MLSPTKMREHLEEKAVEDLEFREKLVSAPKATIEEEFGIAIPEGIEVQVHESDMSLVHLALPPAAKLQDEQLMAAAGGTCASCG